MRKLFFSIFVILLINSNFAQTQTNESKNTIDVNNKNKLVFSDFKIINPQTKVAYFVYQI